MKKPKRPVSGKSKSDDATVAAPTFVWWPWLAAAAALFLTFTIYGPSMNGPFVLDDRYLPFYNPAFQTLPIMEWLKSGLRPFLNLTFWINYQLSGTDPYAYHATNVVLHFFVAVLAGLIAMRLLKLAGTASTRPPESFTRTPEPSARTSETPARTSETEPRQSWSGLPPRHAAALGIFAGALFLVHPIQTESVAYVASRSEIVSVLFYYAAYCVFLYRQTESITWTRALFITVLFACALGSKQHTLTLPLLLLITDLFWSKGGVRANWRLYALMGTAGVLGGAFVLWVLHVSNTVGLNVQGMTPFSYFFTQCRVVWDYTRLFFLPIGQNADPEVALSNSLLDHGALLALAAWIAVAAAAWIYRKRWPLASFGIFVYLLLLAPTSSFVPIQDVMQERRLYLPFIGLALVCLELLRRVPQKRRVMIEAPILLALAMATFARNTVWGEPLKLWQDTAEKSPGKVRPRFQLAFAYGEQRQYDKAAENYEIASKLATPEYSLLVDWGKALEDSGKLDEALDKFERAAATEHDPQAWVLIAEIRGKQHHTDEALAALDKATAIDPNYELTFAIRGNVYESAGNFPLAAQQYQKVLEMDPSNEPVKQALDRVRNR
ncbi:MAG TPA: tetratricopeptide repeat protein [Bryobacteraceae bacterium]|jgi:Tfp pilus assembly protein PilF